MLEDRILLAAGDLDSNFGDAGKLITDFGLSEGARDVAIQSDNKIVVAGGSSAFGGGILIRYNADGSLDDADSPDRDGIPDATPGDSFGNGGVVSTELQSATAVAIQDDGKIVVAGTTEVASQFDFGVERYDANGGNREAFETADFGFVNNDQPEDLAIDSDGRVVVVGNSIPHWLIARYNASGSLDQTFDGDGKRVVSFGSDNSGLAGALAVAIDTNDEADKKDDRIVLVGRSNSKPAVVRLEAGGGLDSTFEGGGQVAIESTLFPFSFGAATAVVIDDGNILLGGNIDNDFGLIRLESTGKRDTTFGFFGFVTTDFGTQIGLERTNPDGSKVRCDTTDSITGLVVQSDGMIIATGSSTSRPEIPLGFPFGPCSRAPDTELSDFALAAFTPTGDLEPAFGTGGLVVTNFLTIPSSVPGAPDTESGEKAASAARAPDGKILLVGNIGPGLDFALAQYLYGLAGADLVVTQTASPLPAIIGNDLTYTITVRNNGPHNATGVTLEDTLDSNVTLVSVSTSLGSCAGASSIACNLGGLAIGDQATISVVVHPMVTGNISNHASVTAHESDPDLANNVASVTTTIHHPTADLEISVNDIPDPVVDETDLIYRITVTNNGPINASEINLEAPLDDLDIEFVLAEQGGCLFGIDNVVVCNLGELDRNESTEVVIRGRLIASGTITNSMSVSTDGIDHDLSNNTATASTSVASQVDLKVTVTDLPDDEVALRSVIGYTIEVSNNGRSDATGVILSSLLSPDLDFVSATPAGICSDSGNELSCDLGMVPSGGATTVVVAALVRRGLHTQVAAVSSATSVEPELDPSDNESTASALVVEPAGADLVIEVTANLDSVVVGDNLSYTLQVTNEGSEPAINAVVFDFLPESPDGQSKLRIDEILTGQGSCEGTGATVICDLGTLEIDQQLTISIATTALQAGPFVNVATVESETFDPQMENNTAVVITDVPDSTGMADLVVNVVIDPDPAITSTDVTYTFEVINVGPDQATDVILSEYYPTSNLIPMLTDPNKPIVASQGSCFFDNIESPLRCYLGSIDPAESATVTLTIAGSFVDNREPLVNIVVATTTSSDPDLVNNEVTTVTPVLPRIVDLVVDLNNADTVLLNEELLFEVVVTNNGPHDIAIGPLVGINFRSLNSELAPDLTLTSVPNCVPVPQQVVADLTCDLAGLQAGGDFVVELGISSAAAGELVVESFVVEQFDRGIGDHRHFDPNPLNNFNAANAHIVAVDLTVNMTSSSETVLVGEELSYIVEVANNGPDDATEVIFEHRLEVPHFDRLRDNIQLIGIVTSQGDCQLANPPGRFTSGFDCQFGTIQTGQSVLVEIVVVPTEDDYSIGSTALAFSDLPDLDRFDNVSSDTTEVLFIEADLRIVSAIDSADPATVFSDVTYTVEVANDGPYPAQVNLALPAQAPFLFPREHCLGGRIHVCTESRLVRSGETSLFEVVVQPNELSTSDREISLSFRAESDIPDPDLSNNTAEEITTVVAETDLAISISGPATSVAGHPVIYDVTVENLGPDPVPGVTVPRPDWLSRFTICHQIDTLYPGDSITQPCYRQVHHTFHGVLTSTIEVAHEGADPDLSNNISSAVTQVVEPEYIARLEATITAAPRPIELGQLLTTIMTVVNHGPDNATNVTVSRDLTHEEFASVSSTFGTCVLHERLNRGGDVICTIDELPVGEPVTVTVETRPTKTGTLVVSVEGRVSPDAYDLSGAHANDYTQVEVFPGVEANLVINVSGAKQLGDVEMAFYRLEVHNLGPSAIENAVVSDFEFQGLRGLGGAGCGFVGGLGFSCDIGFLRPGGQPWTELIVTELQDAPVADDQPEFVRVTATVSSELVDVDLGNNVDWAQTRVRSPCSPCPMDADGDRVESEVESGAPNMGDGNMDGVPDSQQERVASLPNAVDERYVTLESPPGTNLRSVRTSIPTPPIGVSMPIGLVGFSVHGLETGGATTVTLHLPPGIVFDTYYKYGGTPDDFTPHWYEFLYDPARGTGAEILSDRILLHFVDGQFGDYFSSITTTVNQPNGSISDPGGPALRAVPSLEFGGPIDGTVREELAFRFIAEPTSEYRYAVDWDGNGTVDQFVVGSEVITVEHSYLEAGEFTVHVTATNTSTGVSGDASHNLTIVSSAGNIMVRKSGRKLIIRGDDFDNEFKVEQVRRRLYRISGLNGTNVNGKSESAQFARIRSVHISSKQGDDTVLFDGQSHRVDGLLIDTGKGDDTVEVTGNKMRGRVTIRTGLGNDHVKLVDLALRGRLQVDTHGGNDRVTLKRSFVLDRTLIRTQSGADLVTIDDSKFDSLIMNLGRDDDELFIERSGAPTGPKARFDGLVLLRTGPGNDRVAIGLPNQAGNSARFRRHWLNESGLVIDMGLDADQLDAGLLDSRHNGNHFFRRPFIRGVDRLIS